ncbi:P-loop NTPase family protein [Haladaptatus caseinilyticus]|uniref:hypothetical protein n=1 Tax=Haladaptatus caseinilyticus TaxID=2993314 RepID=UPI00224B9F57|nr:hypothetical protein [Haladaptatus caseinilyticus]
MTDLPFPLSGSTLIVGPSQTGKTRLTAQALDAWIERKGTEGVVVLEFAPEVERDECMLGGRLDRFTTIPDRVWYGVLEANAPRSEGKTEEKMVALAQDNAKRASRILDEAANPRVVFVNDATIPYQHKSFDSKQLTSYCKRAECVVMNAFESDELGTDDPVSRYEREAVGFIQAWVDRTISL